jgi:hypothetical protein
MTGPEHFLSRWSRKKQEERQEQTTSEAGEPATPPADAASAAPPPADRAAGERGRPVATPPAFDPASLPSIDSIGAQTDIAAFLKPGVPTELRHAALRRAWSVDPAIRDFKGLQENDWDFNDPNGIPGFGPLSGELNVRKMAAALFGAPPKENPATPASEPAQDDAARPLEPDSAPPVDSDSSNFVQREENIASRDKESETDSAPVAPRRRGGGALPQ